MSDTSDTPNELPAPDPGTGLPDLPPPDLAAEIGNLVGSRFATRTETSAAPLDASPVSDAPTAPTPEHNLVTPIEQPGGVSVDVSERFAQMAQELTKEILPEPPGRTAAAPATPPPDQVPPEPAPDELPPPDPSTQEPLPLPEGYNWHYLDHDGTQKYQNFSDMEVQQAIQVATWANGLSDDQRQAISAITDGQGIVIPRAYYDQFAAFVQDQESKAKAPVLDPNTVDLDPQVAAVINDLRSQVSDLTQRLAPQQQQPNQQALLQQNAAQTSFMMQGAINEYGNINGLTPDQTSSLVQSAIAANAFNHFQRQGTVVNPVTNQIMQQADPRWVVQQALTYALSQNPTLAAQVQARLATPTSPGHQQQVPAQTNDNVIDMSAVTAKKARAGSLASAPSAAVAPSPRQYRTLTGGEMVTAIADDIARALAE